MLVINLKYIAPTLIAFSDCFFCFNCIPAKDHHKLKRDLSCWNRDSVVRAPVLLVLPLRGPWKGLTCVKRPGSSWKRPALQSERDPHPADPQSRASNSHQPENKPEDGFHGCPLVLRESHSLENQFSCLRSPRWCSLCHLFHAKLPQHRCPNLRRCQRKSPPTFCTCDNALKRGNKYMRDITGSSVFSFKWMTDLTCLTWPPAQALMSQCSSSSFQRWMFACS